MIAQLPPEIWGQISEHLRGPDLIPLMGVNQTFMHHAMKAKYRELNLASINGPGQRALESIREKDWIAELVLSVHIGHVCVFTPTDSSSVGTSATPSSLYRKFKSLVTGSGMHMSPTSQGDRHVGKHHPHYNVTISPSAVIKLVSDVLPRLRNVTSLSVNYRYKSESLVYWRVCDSAAQYLPLGVDFPKLKDLCIRTTIKHQADGVAVPDINILAHFINQFQNTLARLTLVNYEAGRNLNLKSMYDTLGYFPNLISIDISSTKTGYKGFIERHAGTLQEIYCSVGDTFSDGLGPIEFNRLETVNMIVNSRISTWWTSPSPFLKSILSTVKTLRIQGANSGEEITNFLASVTAISGRQGPRVDKLSISQFDTLTIETLLLIASTFSRLRSLEITFYALVTEGVVGLIQPNETYPFNEEGQLEDVSFATKLKATFLGVVWDLEDISINCYGHPDDSAVWGVMHICSQIIPSISSFNSTGNMRIPDNIKLPSN
ncbi:hypothetical protein FA15DRAFT_758205 [Coprinopsis marcescibilis]|uniref:F-box domain-containing protein n=1 Tax=Coprinopsis marcescibilis TaxID=230819 RepID=A0A5C3KPS1_COPMA|nr:hypothetical protein FA15DRAFT_758205 [Coprinopsis marcescibilis]